MKNLSISEMKKINGGGNGIWNAIKTFVVETIDDLEGSMQSLVKGAQDAPLKR